MSEQATTLSARITAASEIATRIGGAVLIAIYGTGFLIVSLHHATYGIAQFDLLRPRIFAAGTLFLFLTTVPAVTAMRVFPRTQIEPVSDLTKRFLWSAQNHTGLALACLGLAFAARFLLFEDVVLVSLRNGVFLVTAVAFAPTVLILTRKIESRPLVCFVLSLVALLLLAAAVILYQDKTLSLLCGWFFITGVIAKLLRDALYSPSKRRETEWERLTIYAVTFLSVFAVVLYGRLSAKYGGGAPVPVVIFTSQHSPLIESESQKCLLVDENEQGFYLVMSKTDKRAIFLPRSSVSGIYFGQDLPALNKE